MDVEIETNDGLRVETVRQVIIKDNGNMIKIGRTDFIDLSQSPEITRITIYGGGGNKIEVINNP